MPRVFINKFDGGIQNDPRTPSESQARMITNFDALTDSYRLTPYRSAEDGGQNQATYKIKNFCIAQLNATPTYNLYGLGISSTGSNRAKVFRKGLTTNSTVDLSDDIWVDDDTNNESSIDDSGVKHQLFIYYKTTGLIYGAGVNKIWAYDPSDASAWDDDVITTDSGSPFSFTNTAQGLVHSKDDILYIPYDNKIAKNNNGVWTNEAVKLPSNLRIRTICEFGNYIAIGAEPITGATPGFGMSIVYLWDRDSTLETLSESIQWGDERLFILEEVNGTLVGISASTGNTRFDSRVIFRYLSVSSAIKFAEFTSSTALDLISSIKQKINNRLYFLLEATINGTSRNGIWSVGGVPGNFTIVHERSTNNNSTFTDLELFGFIFVGDYVFISYTDTVSFVTTNYLSKTESGTSYSQNCFWESLINPKMVSDDRIKQKTLEVVSVHFEPLSSGESVKLEYRVDGGSWTEIFTHTTAGDVVKEKTVDTNGSQFTSGREYEFRITSSGGAVITGFYYYYDTINTQLK